MKPANVSDNEILWHPSSSKRFEQHVNCVTGELTEDDIKWINTRVLGYNELELTKDLEGNACYACWKNMERAALFEKPLQATHPPKNSKVIEAGIESRT